jgi:tetratricopeptide (TPR) repeat protein
MDTVKKLVANADALRNQGKSLDSIKIYKEAIKAANVLERPEVVAECYQMIGVCWKIENNIEKALENYDKAIGMFRKIDALEGEGNTLRDKGIVFSYQHKYEEALIWLYKSEKVLQNDDNPTPLGITKSKIGLVLTKLKRFDEAEKYLTEGLALIQSASGDKYNWFMEMTTYLNWAELCFAQGEDRQMIEKLWAAYGMIFNENMQVVHSRRVAQVTGMLAQGYAMLGNYSRSVELFSQSIEVLKGLSETAREVVSEDYKANELVQTLQANCPNQIVNLPLKDLKLI